MMTNGTSLDEISSPKAQQAIASLMAGEPPILEIVDYLSVGLEKDMQMFEQHYFRPNSFVVSEETLGSTFKIVEAYYGGGKTHYLRCVERTAHRNNFVSAFVGLKKTECPLTRFDLIYSAVAENITSPSSPSKPSTRGLSALIERWVDEATAESEEPFQALRTRLDAIQDLPLVSLKIALQIAAEAHAAGDRETFDEAMVYLTSGKIPNVLKKRGVLQAIDAKNGSLALRTLAALVTKLGYAGFVLIFDEGDRSLSLGSAKEKKAASNNLVQLINETASSGAWPATVLLYSIPSWQSFSDAFADNQALIQRTELTGFPMIPPAPRIVLDDRENTDEEKTAFCVALAARLDGLFKVAYPEAQGMEESSKTLGKIVAVEVLLREISSTYRRLFVQSYLSGLFRKLNGESLDEGQIKAFVMERDEQLAAQG